MRSSSRLLAAALLAVGVVSCTDNRSINTPIPPGMHPGKVELNPVFSPAAKAISASLGDFGLTFDHVRIVIRNNPDTTKTVSDTTVVFGPTSNALTLDLTVPVDVEGQIFNALVQYTGPSGVVFSGTILVQSHAPDAPAPEQQNLVLNFVGPGAKLQSVTLAPKPVSLVGAQSVVLTVTAKDSSGATITPLPPMKVGTSDASIATATLSGSTLTVTSIGKRGAAMLTLLSPNGIGDSVSAAVTLPPAKIVLVSGGGQTAAAGTSVANVAVVQVNASDDVGVPGVSVTFAPPIGGSVGTTTVLTDASGRASTTMTLATTTGAQSFLATTTGLNVAIPASSVAGPMSPAQTTINATSPILADNKTSAVVTVQARDQYQNLITTGGATINLSTTLGHFAGGTATTAVATDNNDGTYTATILSSYGGTATITGSIVSTPITSTVTTTFVTPPVGAIVLVSGGGQSGIVGTALTNPAVVQVNMANGTGIAGIPVTFAPSSGGSVGATTVTTDIDGRASTTLTLATVSGAQTFTATTGNFNVAIPETAASGPISPAQTLISATSPILANNTTASVVTVTARDQYQNLIKTGGVTINLTTTAGHFGTGTATTIVATDNNDGTYAASLFSRVGGAGTISGAIGQTPITSTSPVTFVAGTLDHFDVTKPDGTPIGPIVTAGSTFAVKITARDPGNNVIPSYTGQPKIRVTNSFFSQDSLIIAPAAVSGVTTANVAIGSTGSNVTLDVTGTLGTITVTSHSAPFTVGIGPAANLVPTDPVVVSDFDSSPNYPEIQVQDAGGNAVVNQAVTFTLVNPIADSTSSPRCRFAGDVSSLQRSTNTDGAIAFDGSMLEYAGETSGPYSCLLHAQATATNGTVLTAYVPLVVRPNAGNTWVGRGGDNSWTNSKNWFPANVPAATADVFIPWATSLPLITTHTPALAADAAIRDIELEDLASVDLNGRTLTVGDVVNGRRNGKLTDGIVKLTGSEASIQGILPDVNCFSGSYSLASFTTVSGSFSNTGCQISLDGSTLTVNGSFVQTGTAGLYMLDAIDSLDIGGTTVFNGASETGFMPQGGLTLRGDFSQAGNPTSFAPSFMHRTHMMPNGSSRSISLASPSTSPFTYLDIAVTPQSPLTFPTAIRVDSVLTITAPTGGSLALLNGMVNTRNGRIIVGGTGLIVNVGGPISASGLSFDDNSTVTFSPIGNVTLTSDGIFGGTLFFRANSHTVINGTGTFNFVSCFRDRSATITGSNPMVQHLNDVCGDPD